MITAITEKPRVAKEIAKNLNTTQKENRYYPGNG